MVFIGKSFRADKVPMLIIFLVFLAMGEVVRIVSARGRAAPMPKPQNR